MPGGWTEFLGNLSGIAGWSHTSHSLSGLNNSFREISPLLPNSNWASQTLLGFIAPILGIILVRQIYSEETGQYKVHTRKEGIASWLLTGLASILIYMVPLWVCLLSPPGYNWSGSMSLRSNR
jgi:hypothetical protein